MYGVHLEVTSVSPAANCNLEGISEILLLRTRIAVTASATPRNSKLGGKDRLAPQKCVCDVMDHQRKIKASWSISTKGMVERRTSVRYVPICT